MRTKLKQKNIGLLVTDGVGIRNFVFGGFLEEAERKKCRIVVFHFFSQEKIAHIQADYPQIIFEKLPDFIETRFILFWRRVMEDGHRRWANTNAMRYILNKPVTGSFSNQLKFRLIRLLSRFYNTPSRLKKLQQKLLMQVRQANDLSVHEQLLKKHQIDVLFVSNQKPVSSSPTVLACQNLKIPSVVFIFSWDNLTTKGKILSPFDHYFTWGSVMKQELLTYYPMILEKNIHIVGTPQFNSHFNREYYLEKEVFCASHGLNPKHPIILYSGGTPDTIPQDQDYVAAISKIISKNSKLNKAQLILRPSPVDNGKRFQPVIEKYNFIKLLNPKWYSNCNGGWHKALPQKTDGSLLLNTLLHSDIVINTASTMTIDAFLLGKPVINTAIDSEPYALGKHIHEFYYKFEHYLPVIDTKSTRVVTSEQALEKAIIDYLDNPSLDEDNRNLFLKREIGIPVEGSNKTILDKLKAIIGSE